MSACRKRHGAVSQSNRARGVAEASRNDPTHQNRQVWKIAHHRNTQRCTRSAIQHCCHPIEPWVPKKHRRGAEEPTEGRADGHHPFAPKPVICKGPQENHGDNLWRQQASRECQAGPLLCLSTTQLEQARQLCLSGALVSVTWGGNATFVMLPIDFTNSGYSSGVTSVAPIDT